MSDQRGYLSHSTIKAIVFWTLTVCILIATISAMLGFWGTIEWETARRCFMSCVVLATGSVVFLTVNFLFGKDGMSLFIGKDLPPPDDSFGDKFHKAKDYSRRETDPTPNESGSIT